MITMIFPLKNDFFISIFGTNFAFKYLLYFCTANHGRTSKTDPIQNRRFPNGFTHYSLPH